MPRTRAYPHGPDALDQLRELVEAAGLPRSEIAGRAGMMRQQLVQVLDGARPNPSIGTIARVLAALDKTWADLDP
jgi:transcriptional regulator with XRE-family HTH domain